MHRKLHVRISKDYSTPPDATGQDATPCGMGLRLLGMVGAVALPDVQAGYPGRLPVLPVYRNNGL